MFWSVAAVTVLVLLVTRILWRRWRYDLHKVPSPPGWPLLGHTLDFTFGEGLTNVTRWFGKSLKYLNYPKLMRFDVAGKSWLVVTDDEFIRNVMMSNRDPFPRVPEDGRSFVLVLGNNVQAKSITIHTEVTPYVKAIRRVYTNAFQSSKLKSAMPKVRDVIMKTISVIESMREKGPIDVQKLLVSMTLDVIGSVAFDKYLGGLDGSGEILDLIIAAGYIMREDGRNPLKTAYCKLFPYSKLGRHRRSVVSKLRHEWKLLTDEILARDDPVSDEEPIWYGLKHLTDPETNERVDYDVILAEVAGVVVGGMDSTGHQLGFILALLATRPDVVSKILDELKQHDLYGENQREFQFEDLSNLVYLTAAVKEGMRLTHINAMSFRRKVPRDMDILGYRIPKGTGIMQVSNRSFLIDIDWNDPESFKPERWLNDDEICRTHNMQFSTGPRDCPGQKLSMLEMRVATIYILREYEVSLVGSVRELIDNVASGVVLEAKDGIWLNFTPRKSFPGCGYWFSLS